MNIRIGPFRLYSHHLANDDDVYMRRWILLHPWGTVRLHNIRRPDVDPDLHDHPWDFVSVILRGGYIEEVKGHDGVLWLLDHRAGAILSRRAVDAHRIDSVRPSTWTLVFSGRRIKSWGFYTAGGFVPWRVYTTRKLDVAAYEARLREAGQ